MECSELLHVKLAEQDVVSPISLLVLSLFVCLGKSSFRREDEHMRLCFD
jgi:hypothetical protein